tara:strand:- start:8317 stop:8880 length:564 start_codon:yes stop_codon:yes gene_type:complete
METNELLDNIVEKETIFYSVKLINGMFFLVLILSSGFVSEIVSCKYQKLVKNNIYIKHLLAFLILYFLNTNLFTIKDHPTKKIRNSLILYLIFLVVMRQTRNFTIVIFTLIFIIHILYQYYIYYKDNDKLKYDYHIEKLHITIRILSIITIIIALVGLMINYNLRKKEYGRNFDTIKFILGNTFCSK